DRLDARTRHAVCAVPAALRQRALSAEDQLGDSVRVRRADWQAALSASATRWIAGGVLVTCRRERSRLHRGPRRRHPRDPPRVDVRSACEKQAGRRIRCLTGAGGQCYLPARLPESVLHRPTRLTAVSLLAAIEATYGCHRGTES